ncbi:hypothetical protein ACMGDM_19900 [Sphingomonas sp. DT-51]|uniref:hypothetical protein n=1 Tax=Sphingomonas sp. DT-51 TaxID=3396165 RepID=UPI003F19DF76
MPSRPSLADLFDYDGATIAGSVRRPTLVLEGLEDWQVRSPQGLQVAEAMRRASNEHVTYKPLPGVVHLLTPNPAGVTDFERLTNYTVDRRVTEALTNCVRQAKVSSG